MHDDLAYTAGSGARREQREAGMRSAWREASARFVISEALGREYCERYGVRDYQVVTDGLTDLMPPRVNADPDQLRIYFMGLFHMVYERNFRALLDGLKIFERQHPSIRVQVTCRCEHIRAQVLEGTKAVTVLAIRERSAGRQRIWRARICFTCRSPLAKRTKNSRAIVFPQKW